MKLRYEKKRAEIAAKQRAYVAALRREVITAYGGACKCCDESRIEFLTIDHVGGGGAAHRRELKSNAPHRICLWLKRNGFPKKKFRILCMNCNFSYGVRGYCPHQMEK